MNANQILNMILRMFFRKAVNRGMTEGFRRMSKSGKGAGKNPEAAARNQKQGRDAARRARQGLRVIRRIGRF